MLETISFKNRIEILEKELLERNAEIAKLNEKIEGYIQLEKNHELEMDLKNEEIIIANSNMEQAYLNLRLLSDLGKDIISYLNIDQISSVVYQNIYTLMDCDVFAIGILGDEKTGLRFMSSYYRGKKLEEIENEVIGDRCMLCYAIDHELEIITNDLKTEYPQFTHTFPKISTFKGISSAIAIPLKSKGKNIGILTVQSFRKNSYSDYHFNLLRNLAVYVSIALDNTKTYQKLNEQKEELQKVNSSKDKLFSIIGHDLRGPVGTIKSFLDFLIENPEKASKEKTRHILMNMAQSLGSAYTLLDNLFVWARDQRGQIMFKPVEFDIEDPIDESISLLLESCRYKGIVIDKEIDFASKVFGDRIMIGTIIRNLISNAIKFTPSGGQILVKVGERLQKFSNGLDELAEIEVIDSGIGIKEEDIFKILSPNEIFTTEGTDQEKGSGLGLRICIDFLNRHKKELFIENNKDVEGKPETGATFRFYLDSY